MRRLFWKDIGCVWSLIRYPSETTGPFYKGLQLGLVTFDKSVAYPNFESLAQKNWFVSTWLSTFEKVLGFIFCLAKYDARRQGKCVLCLWKSMCDYKTPWLCFGNPPKPLLDRFINSGHLLLIPDWQSIIINKRIVWILYENHVFQQWLHLL